MENLISTSQIYERYGITQGKFYYAKEHNKNFPKKVMVKNTAVYYLIDEIAAFFKEYPVNMMTYRKEVVSEHEKKARYVKQDYPEKHKSMSRDEYRRLLLKHLYHKMMALLTDRKTKHPVPSCEGAIINKYNKIKCQAVRIDDWISS